MTGNFSPQKNWTADAVYNNKTHTVVTGSTSQTSIPFEKLETIDYLKQMIFEVN